MLEALQAAWNQKETLAARPVTWKGMGVGIIGLGEMFVIVTKDGLALSPIPGDETFKEWETVTTEVIDEEIDVIVASEKMAEKLLNHGKDKVKVTPDVIVPEAPPKPDETLP